MSNHTFRLWNTKTQTCEAVPCAREQCFKTYCCGPTVYGPAHIGNFRTYVVQDTVVRLLHLLGAKVRYVRNLTDVDDKTILGSIKHGQSLEAYTDYWIDRFHADCAKLHLLPPTIEPRATKTIEFQQALIQRLLEKNHAYVSNGSVYFRIASFKNYGALSHLETRSLQTQMLNSAGTLNDADEYEREQIADFVLWKAYKPSDGSVFWESPWGRGRPGWHIECSAMAHEFLGQPVDLHTGGVDLIFPHHENEIAQSEAAYGEPFTRHWMHVAHLQVEGKKMAKSFGNWLTLDGLQEKHYNAAEIRYALLAGHYRQPLNFTFDLLHAAQCALQKIRAYTRMLQDQLSLENMALEARIDQAQLPGSRLFLGEFFAALLDDLNVPRAAGCLFSLMHQYPTLNREQAAHLLDEWCAMLYVLGIAIDDPKADAITIPQEIQTLAQQRWLAKQAHRFQEADDLRQTLEQKGWRVLDTKENYTLDPLP